MSWPKKPPAYTVLREGNPNFQRRFFALYLRQVGPRGTVYDYSCFGFKFGRLRFFVYRYYYGLAIRSWIEPKRIFNTGARRLINCMWSRHD